MESVCLETRKMGDYEIPPQEYIEGASRGHFMASSPSLNIGYEKILINTCTLGMLVLK